MSEQDEQTEQLPEVVEIEGGTWKATCQTCGKWSVTKAEKISAIRALSAHMGSCPGKASPSESKGEPGGSPPEEEELPAYRHELKELGHILRDYGVSDQLIGRIKSQVLEDPAFLDSTGEFEELLRSQGITNEHKVKVMTKQIFKAIRPNVMRGFSEDDREERGRPRREFYQNEPDREELKELKAELKEVRERLQATQLQGLQDQINDLKRTPSFVDQYESFLAASERLGLSQNRGGKTTVDLISDGMANADKRADRLEGLLTKREGEFKPEVKRTPQQRQEAANDIQKNLEKKEKILEAENALLIAAARD